MGPRGGGDDDGDDGDDDDGGGGQLQQTQVEAPFHLAWQMTLL